MSTASMLSSNVTLSFLLAKDYDRQLGTAHASSATITLHPSETVVERQTALRPIGILVVEDDGPLRKALGKGFRNRGFDLWSATNGAQGVEIYEQFWPLIDVVLSEVDLPVLNGPRMFNAIQKTNPLVRFCFMTDDSREETRAELLKRGALRVFQKPFPSVADVAQELWELAEFP